MKKLIPVIVMLTLVLSLAATSCAPKTTVETVAEFYQGKTLDLVITHRVGGGADKNGRVIAPFLDKYMGTTTIVSNKAGGGSAEGVVYVYNAPSDGLTLMVTSGMSMIMNKITGREGTDYEIAEFNPIIFFSKDRYALWVAPDGPYQSLADLQAAKGLKFGAQSKGGGQSLGGSAVIEMLGLDAQVVSGYGGMSDITLAIRQGELAGSVLDLGEYESLVPSGLAKPLFLIGTTIDERYPDLTPLGDLISLEGEKRTILEIWQKYYYGTDRLIAPPQIPADRLQYLREIAIKLTEDTEFRAQLDALYGYHVTYFRFGEDAKKDLEDIAREAGNYKGIFESILEKHRI